MSHSITCVVVNGGVVGALVAVVVVGAAVAVVVAAVVEGVEVAVVAVFVTVVVVAVTVDVAAVVPTCAMSRVVGARPKNMQPSHTNRRVRVSMKLPSLVGANCVPRAFA